MAKKAKPTSRSTGNALAAAPMPMPAKMTKEQQEQERKWRAEDALRTITRAEEIKRDGSLMREVKRMAQEQVKSLQRVTGGNGNARKPR